MATPKRIVRSRPGHQDFRKRGNSLLSIVRRSDDQDWGVRGVEQFGRDAPQDPAC